MKRSKALQYPHGAVTIGAGTLNSRKWDPSLPPGRQKLMPPTRAEYDSADLIMLQAIFTAAGRNFHGEDL